MAEQNIQIGELIQFCKYQWRVLDIQGQAALIITEDVIEKRVYHHTLEDVTWATCHMRQYLNGEFYDGFTRAEQSKIITVTNKTPNNLWFDTCGGEDTRDSVFNLTIEDVVCKYFGDSSHLLYNRGKNQMYWFQRKDPNNFRRIARYEGVVTKWHLRTPGRYQNRVACIGADGDNPYMSGSAHITGNPVYVNPLSGKKTHVWDFMGVRPALWLCVAQSNI